MGDRPGSLSGCARVRTKVCKKDYGCSVGLVYDSREFSRMRTSENKSVQKRLGLIYGVSL
jgi:hypothetical protein